MLEFPWNPEDIVSRRVVETDTFPDDTQQVTVKHTDRTGMFIAATELHKPRELPPIEGLTSKVVEFITHVGIPLKDKPDV